MAAVRPKTWILVADGSRARVFKLQGRALEPALPEDFAGPNVPSRDIVSDRPGRAFDSHGAHRHAMEPREDPKQGEERRFLEAVATAVEEQAKRDAFERLIVAADPRSLGVLRASYGAKTKERVKDEVAKDLSWMTPEAILDHLADKIVI